MVADFGFRILLHGISYQLFDGLFLKEIDLQDLQQGVQTAGQMKPLFQDSHKQVDAKSHPDLDLDGIGRRAEEGLDPQVLLDPLEEQLDLPAQLEDVRHGLCRDREDVGQKHKTLFRFGLHVGYPSQGLWIGLPGAGARENDGLIGTDGFLDRARGRTPAPQIALGPDDEEGRLPMDGVESPEVRVAAIQRHDGLFLQGNGIQEIDIVHTARCQADEGRNRSPQIQQGMQLDGSFGLAERRPGKERQAKVDRRGVQGIDRVFQFDVQLFAPVEGPGHGNEMIPEVLVDPIIPQLVGVRQG